VAIATTVLFLLCASAAFAYYLLTFTGSGSGSAKVGEATGTGMLALSAKLPEGLKPGGSGTVSYYASNPTASQPGYVQQLYNAGVSVDTTHASAGCKASWFVLKSPSAALETLETTPGPAEPTPIPVGGAPVLLGTDTLEYVESGTNQTACSGATITINLTSA